MRIEFLNKMLSRKKGKKAMHFEEEEKRRIES